MKPKISDAAYITVRRVGWYDGVEGMKIGGVREVTIPAGLAYGETGSGEDIPPNTPIKFLIMAIPPAE